MILLTADGVIVPSASLFGLHWKHKYLLYLSALSPFSWSYKLCQADGTTTYEFAHSTAASTPQTQLKWILCLPVPAPSEKHAVAFPLLEAWKHASGDCFLVPKCPDTGQKRHCPATNWNLKTDAARTILVMVLGAIRVGQINHPLVKVMLMSTCA